MPAPDTISVDKLARLIGTPKCPALIDVRTDEDFEADARLIPSAVRRPAVEVVDWGMELEGNAAVVICQKGLKLSHGAAAYLRHQGVSAEVLEGGTEAWRQAGLPTVPGAAIPPRGLRLLAPAVPRRRFRRDLRAMAHRLNGRCI